MFSLKEGILVLLLCINTIGFSQNEIIPGLPFITNYSFEEYNANPQNWDITQADNGIIYIANGAGILEFDGAQWRLIEMPNKTVTRSIDVSDKGIIYVGGYDEFGYLQPNEFGILEYVSLSNKLPKNIVSFHDVWTTRTINDKVFFQTFNKIFIYEFDTIRVINSDKNFIWSFKQNNTYYTQKEYDNLLIFKDDTFQKIQGSERFNDEFIYALMQYPEDQNMIITSKGNMFVVKIDTGLLQMEIKDSMINATSYFLYKNNFYSGINYSDNKFCLGTFYSGILMIDEYGNTIMKMNKSFGLGNNNIRNIFKDKNDNLWLATDRGISYIDMNLSLTIFNEYSNISGNVNDAIVFDNPNDNTPKRLYVATIGRIYYKDLNTTKNLQKFDAYNDFRNETWGFFSYKNTLLCATSDGVYELKNNRYYHLSYNSSWSFTPMRNNPDLVIVNLDNGFDLLEFKNETWNYKWKIKDFDGYASTSVFDEDGCLWVENVNYGITKLKLSDNYKHVISKKTYSNKNGLPTNTLNIPYKLGKQLKITTEKGVYNFNKKKERFYPDTILNKLIGEKPLDYIFLAPNKNIWYFSTESKSMGELIYRKDETYIKDTSRFNEVKKMTIWNMYYYNDSNVFFCSPNGLILYNKSKRPNKTHHFETLIRKVEIINNPDTIFNIKPPKEQDIIILNYNENSIKFSYTIPYFENVKNNQYCYYLEGLDKGWSHWTSQTEKEYSFLREGNYNFKVKSRNSLMINGNIASFYFKIRPPFYRTLVAYIVYFIIIVFLMYSIVLFKINRLKLANIKLERTINERTIKIRKQNSDLQKHKEYILKQRNDLSILNANKDKFFGIISHDLRSPFNTILGFSEILMNNLKNSNSKENYSFAEIINKSAISTYELLENLLMWSKIQGNNIKYEPEKLFISEVIHDCILKLKHVAETKNIILLNNPIDVTLSVYVDLNMLRTILRNLITNAIKFSESGSTITINAKNSGNNIIISVIDEGVGIPEDNIKKLFKVEKSNSTEGTNKEKGSGLGLILCWEFVKLNKGTIWVKSKKGEGSTFYVSLPKNKVS